MGYSNRAKGIGLSMGVALTVVVGYMATSGQYVPSGSTAQSLAGFGLTASGAKLNSDVANSYGSTHMDFSDEFLAINSVDWIGSTATGAGAAVASASTTTRPGIVDMQTGTTTTGLARWNGASATTIDFASMATATIDWVGGWPILSTVAEEYASVIGFSDQAAAINSTNGCFFLEDRLPVATAPNTGTITAGSTNLQCWCAAAGVRTGFTMDGVIASQEGFTTVATPVAALTLPNTNILRARIVVTGTTRAEFYVDSGAGLTKRCDINTNVPSASRTVIAYPSGLPAIWDGPSFAQQSIPGSWLSLTPASRHYGNAGMGADGTLCLKISRENGSTANTNTEYACRPSGGAWGPYVAHAIGLRHTYDYIFPNAVANGFYGSSTYDVQKDDAGWPSLAGFPYVFNGVNGYSTGTTSDATWQQETVFPALTVPNQSTATVAPLVEQIDAFVDSGGRAFSIDIEATSNGTAQTNTGFHLSVTNPVTGANIYRGLLNVPTFGSVRIFEDNSSRLWVLWTNPGTRATQINVDRLNETTNFGVTTFSLGHVDDLTATFAGFSPGWRYTPYEIHGPVYLAMPRGGTARSDVIDGYLDACTVQFPVDGVGARSDYISANCFNADGSGQMSIVYFQIKLN